MSDFVKVAKISEIPDGQIKKVEVNDQEVALINLDGDIFAVSDVCTHEACSISEYGQIDAEDVECGCHGSKFDIKTGQVIQPPALDPLPTYEVKVEGDDILVKA